jgi:hypothetical protein
MLKVVGDAVDRFTSGALQLAEVQGAVALLVSQVAAQGVAVR